MMFAIVFGLSMDYEVFLVSRVRDSWLLTGDNHQAVATGLAATARVITSAALIMTSIFLAFVLSANAISANGGCQTSANAMSANAGCQTSTSSMMESGMSKLDHTDCTSSCSSKRSISRRILRASVSLSTGTS